MENSLKKILTRLNICFLIDNYSSTFVDPNRSYKQGQREQCPCTITQVVRAGEHIDWIEGGPGINFQRTMQFIFPIKKMLVVNNISKLIKHSVNFKRTGIRNKLQF